jgi:hypothetical protein
MIIRTIERSSESLTNCPDHPQLSFSYWPNNNALALGLSWPVKRKERKFLYFYFLHYFPGHNKFLYSLFLYEMCPGKVIKNKR